MLAIERVVLAAGIAPLNSRNETGEINMMGSDRENLSAVLAPKARSFSPELDRAKCHRARVAARSGILALLLFVALTAQAEAKGSLWLLGDIGLAVDEQATEVILENWVPEIFGAITDEALVPIPPATVAPSVLIIWADEDEGLVGDIADAFKEADEDAFEKADIDSKKQISHISAEGLSLALSGRGRGRGRGPGTGIGDADIIVLIDGSTTSWLEKLSINAQQAIADRLAGGAIVVGQGRAATLFGEVLLTESNSAKDSLSPKEALSDLFLDDLQLAPGFDFAPLSGCLVDVNFLEQGRIGRLPVVLARANQDPQFAPDLLAIGVDDATALRVDAQGRSLVLGGGSVTLQHVIDGETVIDLQGETPHITNLQHHQLTAGYGYDLVARSFTAVPLAVDILSPPEVEDAAKFNADLTGVNALNWPIKGNDPGWKADVSFEGYFTDFDAIFEGNVAFTPGNNPVLENTVYATNALSGSSLATEAGTHLLALAKMSARTALWVPPYAGANLYAPDIIEHNGSSSFGNYSSLLVLESLGATSIAFSDYVESGATNARQSVAITGARLHVIGVGESVALGDVPFCEFPIEVDLNGDGTVDVVDVVVAVIAKNQSPVVPPGTGADLNCNGVVDFFDVYQTIQNAL